MSERKNIAIVGAGFGGLRAALLIGKKLRKLGLETNYRVILIDQNDYHTYTPTLYEVATNDPEHTSYTELREVVTLPIRSLIAGLPIEFINLSVTTANLNNSTITCDGADPISYHYLILAPGSIPNYFDIPGLQQFSTPLKTFRDSIEIREYILMALKGTPEPIQVVVGGGGSAGVEFAGEVRTWLNKIQIESGGSRRSQVSIVETAQTILAPFPPRVIELAQKRLTRIGVRTISNEKIVSVKEKMIMLATGKMVPFDILIWTGGVRANSLMSSLGLMQDQRGRIMVSDTMECSPIESAPRFGSKVYGLGDAITVINKKTNQAIAGTAHTALLQGDVVAHNLIEEIKLREGVGTTPNFESYEPKDFPYIIPVGGKFAIARFGSFIFSGFLGWVLKGLVKLNYLRSLMPLSSAIRLYFKGIRIMIKNDRLQ